MPLNIELLEQVKEQILSHPEKFRMDRDYGCGCIADFTLIGQPARAWERWGGVKERAKQELYAEGDSEELEDSVEALFYLERWDKDLYLVWLNSSRKEFHQREAQLAVQMIDRLIAKYPGSRA